MFIKAQIQLLLKLCASKASIVLAKCDRLSTVSTCTVLSSHSLLPAFDHDDMIAFTGLTFAVLRLRRGRSLKLECNVLEFGQQTTTSLPS